MQYVNFKSIVKNVYEEEIENDQISPAERGEDIYEKNRKYLLEMFDALDFCHELLKKDREYAIPKPDGEFIEWLLREYTTRQMKLIRNGKYQEVEPEYLYKIIQGLEKLLKDLEIDDNTFQAQMEIIMLKTEYPLIVRLHNIRVQMLDTLNNLWNYTYIPTFHLSMGERCKYLDWVQERTKICKEEIIKEFSGIWEKKQTDIKENALKISISDIGYSPRTLAIIEELNNNQEYLNLREELHNLEEKKQPLIKYKKKQAKIVEKMKKILNDVAKDYPLNLEQVTMLEKLMYTTDEGFIMTRQSGDDGWYVIPKTDYKPLGRRL